MSAKRFALQKLSRRSYLKSAMRTLLQEKGFPEEEIEGAIRELSLLGYLNDDEWIGQAIRREIRAKHGPLRILQKLRFLGADSEKTQALLEELYPEEARLEVIAALLSKKEGKERQKQIASIARMGFSIQEILKMCYNKNKREAL